MFEWVCSNAEKLKWVRDESSNYSDYECRIEDGLTLRVVSSQGGQYLQVLRKVDTAQRGTINAQGDAYRNANHTGNGRSTRIWLDLILKKRLKKCTDWSKIDKKAYLSAVQESPVDSTDIFNLIKNALTEDIDNREIFMKGIDYSYYYEQVNE